MSSDPSLSARTRLLLIAVIAIGVFFRLYHVDLKLYNPDEANTSLRLSGHTNAQLGAFIEDGRPHYATELATYAVPTAQTRPGDIVHSLATEDPQHPPLFFLATFASERITGDSVFWRRFPAVVFGLLAIGASWWFGREVFASTAPAWYLAALVAVSPFHVAFAQEAREYSLFLLSMCFSSALLLYALRIGRAPLFVAYGLSVAIGFWGFTLFAFVAAAHAAYLVLPVSTSPIVRRAYAFAALALGSLSFAPWIVNLAQNAGVAENDTSWQAAALTAPLYAGKFLFNFGTVFFDTDYLSLILVPIALACLAIAACAAIVLMRRADWRVWFLPAVLAGITLVVILGPDLVRHETRALQNRYLLSLWFAVEVFAAGGLWLARQRARGAWRTVWNGAAVWLFACGIVSCGVASGARTWWITGAPQLRAFPAILDRLATLANPTVVYFENEDEALLFAPNPPPHVRFFTHAHLDAAALRSASHPYAILTSEEASDAPVFANLVRVPVETSFEMRPDPAVDRLRRSGANARKLPGRLDLALYALR